MKNYIIILNTLLITSAPLYSMEEAATLTAAAVAITNSVSNPTQVQKRPPHLIAADEIVKALERVYQPGVSGGMVPVKGFLDAHQVALEDPLAVVQLQDKERDDLVKWYQAIYLHLSKMSQEEARTHPLRSHKKRIYAAALRLFTSKDAAKQWLKSADCFTDEEKELDDISSQASKAGYDRWHYLTAKHSLTIQKNRAKETEDLKKVSETLQKDSAKVDTQIAQLTLQLAQLNEQKAKQTTNQQKIAKEMQATNRTVNHTITIYDAQLIILREMLQTQTENIKQLEQEIAALTAQASNLPHKKEVQQTELKEKRDTLALLQKDQAAIKRDVDLLTDDYTITKKVLWKLSGFLTSYPVDDAAQATPGKPDTVQAEDKKDSQNN